MPTSDVTHRIQLKNIPHTTDFSRAAAAAFPYAAEFARRFGAEFYADLCEDTRELPASGSGSVVRDESGIRETGKCAKRSPAKQLAAHRVRGLDGGRRSLACLAIGI